MRIKYGRVWFVVCYLVAVARVSIVIAGQPNESIWTIKERKREREKTNKNVRKFHPKRRHLRWAIDTIEPLAAGDTLPYLWLFFPEAPSRASSRIPKHPTQDRDNKPKPTLPRINQKESLRVAEWSLKPIEESQLPGQKWKRIPKHRWNNPN